MKKETKEIGFRQMGDVNCVDASKRSNKTMTAFYVDLSIHRNQPQAGAMREPSNPKAGTSMSKDNMQGPSEFASAQG